MARCQGCNAEVLWLENAKTGRRAPVNPSPDPSGNVVIEGGRYRVLTKKEQAEPPVSLFDMGEAQGQRHTLHFSTCPNADHFRRCKTCHHTPCSCAT